MIVPWRFITYLHLVVFFLMGFHVGKIYVPVPWIDFGGFWTTSLQKRVVLGWFLGTKHDEIWITWILPLNQEQSPQGGPPPVVNGVITSINGL